MDHLAIGGFQVKLEFSVLADCNYKFSHCFGVLCTTKIGKIFLDCYCDGPLASIIKKGIPLKVSQRWCQKEREPSSAKLWIFVLPNKHAEPFKEC